MAAEAGSFTLGGEEPACKKLQPTMGGMTPQERNLVSYTTKEAPKVPTGTVAHHEIPPVPKEHGAPYLEITPSHS